MSSGGFTFPPPPPPPPTSTSSSRNFADGSYGSQRGGWNAGNQRGGRGRGNGHRGRGAKGDRGSGGGYGAPRYPSHNPTTTAPYNNFSQQWPPQTAPYGQPSTSYVAQPPGGYTPMPQFPSYYPSAGQPFASPMMSGHQNSGPNQHPQQGGEAGFRGYNQNTPSNSKFRHEDRRPSQRGAGRGGPRPTAPRPVPSFGTPLPPPPAPDTTNPPAKKKRKFNQLGLTPKTEEHESSEEEEVDEEGKFVAGELKFTYNGETATLHSKTEIIKWIEERKKRYPTEERVAEKARALEGTRARIAAERREKEAEREKARQLAKESLLKKEAESKQAQKEKKVKSPVDAATKARLRAEKLRNKLMKQELKLAKAEAEAEKVRLQTETAHQPAETRIDGETTCGPVQEMCVPDADESPTSDTKIAELTVDAGGTAAGQPEPAVITPNAAAGDVPSQPDLQDGETSSDLSTSDDDSSSGSETSSDESDDDSLPEAMSLKRQQPERVPPPPRADSRQTRKKCHRFAQTGRCTYGDRCKHSHEPRAGGNAQQPSKKPIQAPQEGRKSLFQTLLAKQREDENRRIMQAICWLGERGLLDDSTEKTAT